MCQSRHATDTASILNLIMKRYFNTTGFCNSTDHYMVDPLRGIQPQIYELIKRKQYFTIHAPRQTGKTTLLHSLAHQLNREGQYISVVFSVENAGYRSIEVAPAMYSIITALYQNALILPPDEQPPLPANYTPSPDLLFVYLSDWAHNQTKPIVLLLDEVDSLYDDVFVSTLRQLRNGFQNRPHGFPSSLALVGLRDVRDYKMKVRPEQASLGSGSPFNIKAESFLLPCFTPEQIADLYGQHTADTGQVFSKEVLQKIAQFSGGQPWLVNALANEIIEKILKGDCSQTITVDHVEQAKENLIKRRDTHLDSLIDKLQEERVKPIILAIINGDTVFFDNYDDSLLYCRDLGIVTQDNPVRISNQIYQEIIPRIINKNFQDNFGEEGTSSWYIKPDGKLDMDKLLQNFQKFYRQHAESWIDRFAYKEAGQQLLLMAFLQLVINGGGRIDREMAIGRGRTDLLIDFQGEQFLLELKLKRYSGTKEEGLDQINRYMDGLGLTHGYLILFETKPSTEVPWEERIFWEQENVEGKAVTVVGM